jgi:hypothetical protein
MTGKGKGRKRLLVPKSRARAVAEKRRPAGTGIDFKVLETFTKGLGLPAITAVNPGLGLVLTLTAGGRAIFSDSDLRAQMAAYRRTLERLERLIRILRKQTGLSAKKLRAALNRPDVLEVWAVARDQVAMYRFGERLEEFAGILAGQVASTTSELDESMELARAALDLPQTALHLMADFAKYPEGAPCPVLEQPSAKGNEWAAMRAVDDLEAAGLIMGVEGGATTYQWHPSTRREGEGPVPISLSGNTVTPFGWKFIRRGLHLVPPQEAPPGAGAGSATPPDPRAG